MRVLGHILAVLLVALVGGCARLAVQVDMLAPDQVDHVVEQAVLRQQYTAALSESQASLRNDVRDRLQAVIEVLRQIGAQYQREATAATDSRAGDALRSLARDLQEVTVEDYLLTDAVRRYFDEMARLNQAIRDAVAAAPPRHGQPFEGELARLLRQRLATERGFEATLREEIADIVPSPPTDLPQDVRSRAEEQVDLAIRTNIGRGRGLEDSPYAYAIAKAPESLWATRFNHASGAGLFGNLDVAIKLQRTASFTVKGLTFDPRKVAEVASKVATQSVLLAAQIAGVPVGLAGPPGGAETAAVGLLGPSGRMAELAGKVEGRAARLRDRDQALRDIARAVLAETASLAAGGPAAQQARDALLKIYRANAARLDLSTMP